MIPRPVTEKFILNQIFAFIFQHSHLLCSTVLKYLDTVHVECGILVLKKVLKTVMTSSSERTLRFHLERVEFAFMDVSHSNN